MDSYNLLADGWSGAAGEGSMGQHEWPIHVFRHRPKGGGGY